MPQNGLLVVNAGEPHALALSHLLHGKTVTYGIEEGEWHAQNIVYGTPTTFDLMHGDTKIISLTTPLLGAHNIENIVGISAVLLEKELLTPEELAHAIASFEGVKRRMEYLSPRSSIAVYEGFGSSYEKAKAAVAAMKLHFPARRLMVVFEPHTFTWRNKASLHQYDDVFAGADQVFIFNPPHDGKETQLSAEEIASRVSAHGTPAIAIDTSEAMLHIVEQEFNADDAVLLSSSGAMGGLIESIPKLVEKKVPQLI